MAIWAGHLTAWLKLELQLAVASGLGEAQSACAAGSVIVVGGMTSRTCVDLEAGQSICSHRN